MKSSIKEIELVTDFPCLMEFKLHGEDSIGIYLVCEYNDRKRPELKYSVCLVHSISGRAKKGNTYFKPELNPIEWVHLPKGTQITLTN